MITDSALDMETCQRLCTITLYTPSGTTRYKEGPTPSNEIRIDWVHVMALILEEHHVHEPTQLHLIAGDEHATCYAAGNSFAGLYWVDTAGWQALLTARCSANSHQPAGLRNYEVNVTVTAMQIRPTDYPLRNIDRQRFTITTIRGTTWGHDLTLTNCTTQLEISRNSEQVWHWQNDEYTSIGLMMCTMLAESMPHERIAPCIGCARLLLAKGGPARTPIGHVVMFPARNSTCTCGPQKPHFILVSSRNTFAADQNWFWRPYLRLD